VVSLQVLSDWVVNGMNDVSVVSEMVDELRVIGKVEQTTDEVVIW